MTPEEQNTLSFFIGSVIFCLILTQHIGTPYNFKVSTGVEYDPRVHVGKVNCAYLDLICM